MGSITRSSLSSSAIVAASLLTSSVLVAAEPAAPDYATGIAPVLNRYCAGCHTGDEGEADLALDSYQSLLKGGMHGPALLPGDAKSSRMIRMMTGQIKPVMPPKDKPQPKPEEIALIKEWIETGAKGPAGAEPDRKQLRTPHIAAPAHLRKPVTAAAYAPDGSFIAVGRFGSVEVLKADTRGTVRTHADLPGKVNGLGFSLDGSKLVAASGVDGLYGEVRVWNPSDGSLIRTYTGHRDVIYAAILSPDSKILATGSYDRDIILWDTTTGAPLRTLSGHNHAIYDLAFSPDGKVLASASGDHTVKLWKVDTGERLDTLSQPLKEQYAVAFSPDGRWIVAGGVDNRVRIWKFVSKNAPEINPIVQSRFAHEGAVIRLAFSKDGRTLVSTGEDRMLKLWETEGFTETFAYPRQSDAAPAVALAPNSKSLFVGRLDGSIDVLPVERGEIDSARSTASPVATSKVTETALTEVTEAEPNDLPAQATALPAPGVASGVIQAADGKSADADLYRFTAKAGQQWIVEINAAQSKSPLDSKVEVLDAEGKPIVRVLLQAVRDSYVTFRPIDSSSRDVRLHNWEEMELNQYLYMQGEVCKLFQAPRGPDSGFAMYTQGGARSAYFDTSSITHALHEPCYIVEPHPPGTKLPPVGLPVFPLHYANDDDGLRRIGIDSRLTFTAPADGSYLVRVTDVRGFQGSEYKYRLTVRPPRPDFKVTLSGAGAKLGPGSGKNFSVNVERIDGFDGDVRVDVSGVPPGFSVSTPILIQGGHNSASGTINAAANAPQPTAENISASQVTATAVIDGQEVTKSVNNLGEIKLADKAKLIVALTPPGISPPTSGSRQWKTLSPENPLSAQGATLARLDDQSILASGTNADKDTYTVTCRTDLQGVTAFRLEALGDASLPDGAPGRADATGNFALSEFRVTAAPASDPDKAVPVLLGSAVADFSQSDSPAGNILDGKPETAWAVAGPEKDGKKPVKRNGNDPNHSVVVTAREPVGVAGGTILTFTLDHASALPRHNLGHFRLSVSTDPTPGVPPLYELVIAPGQTITAQLSAERDGFDARVQFNAQNLPHGVIVDNIGLSGILIPEGQIERTIYLSAARWVPETSRLFHLEATVEGNPTTWPVLLHVRHPTQLTQKDATTSP